MKANDDGFEVRTPWQVTTSVWRALFLREAVARLFASRTAWLWLFVEPVVHVVFIMLLFTFVRMRVVGGMDTPLWILVGMMAFFLFRRTGTQGMNAVGNNQSLFNYRQVHPVDTVLARGALEGLLNVLIFIILLALVGFFLEPLPGDPLIVIVALLGLWLLGVGFGLCTSVPKELVPELGKMIGLAMTPLYFASGVIFPLHQIPSPVRDWLMFNPVVHGIELVRAGFAPHYVVLPGVSLGYLYGFTLAVVAFGLLLHIRFAARLTAR